MPLIIRPSHRSCQNERARVGEGKERKGKERKGKERKGKERKGKERKGKERKLVNRAQLSCMEHARSSFVVCANMCRSSLASHRCCR